MRTELRHRPGRRMSRIGCVIAALVIGVTGLGATAYAQSPSNIATVNIDFRFIAGGKAMPAGAYRTFEVDGAQVLLRSVLKGPLPR